jgi:nitroreductase
MMNPQKTERDTLLEVLDLARLAPSIHNSQPWRWRVEPRTVRLYADLRRWLPVTDQDGRDLMLSCGAALHHLRVALAARGLAAAVERLPDPENSDHLATVTVTEALPDPTDAALFGATLRRRTDRRRMSHRPVPAAVLDDLVAAARHGGAELVPGTDPGLRDRIVDALTEAAERQRWVPGYGAELQLWTRRTAGGRDGVGAASIASPVEAASTPLRAFPSHGQLAQPRPAPGQGGDEDAAELLVLVTPADDPADRLRAGEALSAVLLAATRHGLATTPLSQATEVAPAREALGRALPGHPQIIVRVGWPASTAEELPSTPRRDLRSALLPS